MKFPALLCGRFVKRENRFRATVSVDGRETWAHVPNSGRLTDLFTPRRKVWLASKTGDHRKTPFDIMLVEFGDVLVSVDARLPNQLFSEALDEGHLRAFPYSVYQREVDCKDSRLDFLLFGPENGCWVETKSVTLVEGGTALFPDAPTHRGRRHLAALMELRKMGFFAAVVFVVQRPDAHRFRAHTKADPAFGEALCRASRAGVQIHAYQCQTSLDSIRIQDEIPVSL